MTSISDRCKTARDAATPGPWTADEDGWIEGPEFADVIRPDPDVDYGGNLQGNARLAALAPEMADEVIRLTEEFTILADGLDGHGYDLADIANTIRAILNPQEQS